MKILGTPFGHPDFVRKHLTDLAEEQRILLERIPMSKDVQGSWLLLVHCASARANYFLRSVRPEAVAEYARVHDAGLWECLRRTVQVNFSTCGQDTHDVATLPLAFGRGLGLRSTERTSVPANWARARSVSALRRLLRCSVSRWKATQTHHYMREASAAAWNLRGVMACFGRWRQT